MVRLNKNKLSNEHLEKLFSQLSSLLGKQNKSGIENFLSDLLGAEERIMLAKRLGIIVLLHEGQSLYKISNTLKVSTATAENIQKKLQSGAYKHILDMLTTNKKSYGAILQTLESILTVGGIMPSRAGLDRYKFR